MRITEVVNTPYRAASAMPNNQQTETNKRFWSRTPGRFVNKWTGQDGMENAGLSNGPMYVGNVREWCETFVETIHDAAEAIKKRSGQDPNILEVSPNILTILECTMAYRTVHYANEGQPRITMKGAIGELVGEVDHRYHVHVNPNFPADTAKLVLVTDHRVAVETVKAQPLQAMIDGKPVPSYVEDEWTTTQVCKTEPLPSITRLDGMTIKVLDMNIL